MFKEMRRKDKKLDNTEALRILEAGQYGILSTTGSNGYAYGVPISYAYVNNCIYFHCAAEGHKLDNIEQNDRVSFCVVGDTAILPESFSVRYKSVILFGRALEVFGEEKRTALEAIIAKYSPDYIKEGSEYIKNSSGDTRLFKIEIEHMTGKAGR